MSQVLPRGAGGLLTTLQYCILIIGFTSAIIALLGSGLNNLGHKHSRALPSRSCDRQVLVLNVAKSVFCCDEGFHAANWVCVASYDFLNRLLTSNLAFFLPFFPWMMTLITETVVSRNHDYKTAALFRFIWSFLVLLFRTCVLYIIANFIQSSIQDENENCWYAHYMKHQRCKDGFDFSDHIVLYMGQYVLPASLEIAYVSSLVYHKRSTLKVFAATLAAGGIIILLCLRAVFFTGLFFHTPLENVVAVALTLLTLYVPSYFVGGSAYWIACVFGANAKRKEMTITGTH